MKIHMKVQSLGFLMFFAVNTVFVTAQFSSFVGAFNDTDFVAVGGGTFTIGEDTQSITAERTVAKFYINRYETTYRLWYDVRVRAEKRGYIFHNTGQEGSDGRRGKPPTDEGMYQPVTEISWYDAIVWCNAFSELYGRTPCYTYEGKPIRDSSNAINADLAECNWNADGYRLPTEAEWEYAARRTQNGFQSGDLPSGTGHNGGASLAKEVVAWFGVAASHTVGTTGTTGNPLAAPGSGRPNALGLYDMSGNVLEYCWDWFADYTVEKKHTRSVGTEIGSERVSRGGSWSPFAAFILAGDRYAFDPNEFYNYMGFRLVCTKRAP